MKMQYNNARHRKTPINHYLTYICSSYGSVNDVLPSSRALRLDICMWACACMYTYTYVCVCVCMGACVHVCISLMDEWSLSKGSRYGVWRMHCYDNLKTKIQGHVTWAKGSETKPRSKQGQECSSQIMLKKQKYTQEQIELKSRYQGLRHIMTSTQRSN